MHETLFVFLVIVRQPGLVSLRDIRVIDQGENRRSGTGYPDRQRAQFRRATWLRQTRATACAGKARRCGPPRTRRPAGVSRVQGMHEFGELGAVTHRHFSGISSGSTARASRVTSLVPGQQTTARQAPGHGSAYSCWLPGRAQAQAAEQAGRDIVQVNFTADAAFHLAIRRKSRVRQQVIVPAIQRLQRGHDRTGAGTQAAADRQSLAQQDLQRLTSTPASAAASW